MKAEKKGEREVVQVKIGEFKSCVTNHQYGKGRESGHLGLGAM